MTSVWLFGFLWFDIKYNHYKFRIIAFTFYRYDERKLLIVITALASALGRFLFFPIPGKNSPPLCSNATMGTEISKKYYYDLNETKKYLLYDYNSVLQKRSFGTDIANDTYNIPCDGMGINRNSNDSCCPLDWCKNIPAISVPQFVFGWLVGTLGYAYSTAFTISLMSKLLGTQNQVLFLNDKQKIY